MNGGETVNYSPIKTFRLRNFMGIEDLTVSFDGLSRVVLEGYNSTGKSSIGMGLDVLATNSFTTEQKNFIKDTPYQADEFILDCTLQDGHKITYVKPKKGYYYIVEKDGEVLLDTRLNDGSYTVIEDSKVPLLVHQLLGFVKERETKQKLNLRRVADGKLFVGVPGSVNFKVVYRQLDLPEVVDSIKEINQDRLKVDKNITMYQNKKDFLQERYNSIVVYDQEVLEKLQLEVQSIINQVSRFGQIRDIVNAKNQLEAKLTPYIEPVSSLKFVLLNKLFSTANRLETLETSLRDTPSLSTLDISKIQTLAKIKTSASMLMSLKEKVKQSVKVEPVAYTRFKMLSTIRTIGQYLADGLKQVDKLQEVPFNKSDLTQITLRQGKLIEIVNVYNQYQKTRQQGKALSEESNLLRGELEKLEGEIRNNGMTICPRCNNVFKTDKKGVSA